MRSGTIDLASGRWNWTVLPQWTGATIVFHHRERMHDEMRSWTTDTEVTAEQVLGLATEPLERIWLDVDGLQWRLSMELPTAWRREARGMETDLEGMWLVFKRGGVRRVVGVPGSMRLGDLTHTQLRALLEQASTVRSFRD